MDKFCLLLKQEIDITAANVGERKAGIRKNQNDVTLVRPVICLIIYH